MVQTVNNLSAMWETQVQSLGWEDPLEKGIASHFHILAWRIPWTEELGGLLVHGVAESITTELLTVSLSLLKDEWDFDSWVRSW